MTNLCHEHALSLIHRLEPLRSGSPWSHAIAMMEQLQNTGASPPVCIGDGDIHTGKEFLQIVKACNDKSLVIYLSRSTDNLVISHNFGWDAGSLVEPSSLPSAITEVLAALAVFFGKSYCLLDQSAIWLAEGCPDGMTVATACWPQESMAESILVNSAGEYARVTEVLQSATSAAFEITRSKSGQWGLACLISFQ